MPGRPRSFNRDHALQIALDGFWRSGYERASVAALTRAMGINPPSLYAAFGDKQRLFEEAAELYVGRFRRGVSESLDRPTAHEGVTELLRQAATRHTDPDTPPGCLVLTEPRLADERACMRRQIAARVRRGQVDGDVAAAIDADAVGAYLGAVLAGMSTRAREGADRAELQATARLAAAVMD